jgi:hypothetical protein
MSKSGNGYGGENRVIRPLPMLLGRLIFGCGRGRYWSLATQPCEHAAHDENVQKDQPEHHEHNCAGGFALTQVTSRKDKRAGQNQTACCD